jgi:archaeal flagellar protein FlaI
MVDVALPPHVQEHLEIHMRLAPQAPTILADPTHLEAFPEPDLLYPLDDTTWAHIRREGSEVRYRVLEPRLKPGEVQEVEELRSRVADLAARLGDKPRDGTLQEALQRLVAKLRPGTGPQDPVTHRIVRDIAGLGPLDALLRDPHLEDIHFVGLDDAHVIHNRFGMLRTDIRFEGEIALVRFLRLLTERLGRPASDAVPIVDAVLPDGSRLNLVFSGDVSRRGPSLSVRRATDHPISITQLLEWNTLSAEAAGYLWLCLEHGMSMFLCGEAACGKTTTLNALLPFIDPRSKVYSAEDTPEVRPPHRIWQRLLTRETGPVAGQVKMFDLLRAALRSRPDFIVVGEIRGAEGAVAFQAMQTGHPTIASFHATDPTGLVQRLGAPPISVPLTFMDNLNVVVFQAVVRSGGRKVRRVTKIVEIAGVAGEGLVTVPVFERDPGTDRLEFRGRNNSFILEDKIAPLRGMGDPRGIYDEVTRRADILRKLVADRVLEGADLHPHLGHYDPRGEAAA